MSDETTPAALATLLSEARAAFLARVPIGPRYPYHEETRIYPQPDKSEIAVEITASEASFGLLIQGRAAYGSWQMIGQGQTDQKGKHAAMNWQPVAEHFPAPIREAVMAAARGEVTP